MKDFQSDCDLASDASTAAEEENYTKLCPNRVILEIVKQLKTERSWWVREQPKLFTSADLRPPQTLGAEKRKVMKKKATLTDGFLACFCFVLIMLSCVN